ncbi:hypothetical protein Vi05172_g9845 [Venturia inaequalis]|nr:hypothetical protein Vi05172_g9845 [Venturia inaequalis]
MAAQDYAAENAFLRSQIIDNAQVLQKRSFIFDDHRTFRSGKDGRLAVVTAIGPEGWSAHVINPKTSHVLYESYCVVPRAAEKAGGDMKEINMALRALHDHTATALWLKSESKKQEKGCVVM